MAHVEWLKQHHSDGAGNISLTEQEFEQWLATQPSINTNAPSLKAFPLGAYTDGSVEFDTVATKLTYADFSSYFDARAKGLLNSKLKPSGSLACPASTVKLQSALSNPFPRPFMQTELKQWDARILCPDFYKQKQESSMSYEFRTLINAISYLHDTTELLAKLTVSSHDGDVMRTHLTPLVSVLYYVLSNMHERQVMVGAMNHEDKTVSAAAYKFVKGKQSNVINRAPSSLEVQLSKTIERAVQATNKVRPPQPPYPRNRDKRPRHERDRRATDPTPISSGYFNKPTW